LKLKPNWEAAPTLIIPMPSLISLLVTPTTGALGAVEPTVDPEESTWPEVPPVDNGVEAPVLPEADVGEVDEAPGAEAAAWGVTRELPVAPPSVEATL
jgi:hypothetical protein